MEKAVGTVEKLPPPQVVENPWKSKIHPLPPQKRAFEQNAEFAEYLRSLSYRLLRFLFILVVYHFR